MSPVGVYPDFNASSTTYAGDEVSSTYEGRHITVLESQLIHPFHADDFVDKGDPVIVATAAAGNPHAVFGMAVGVALNDGAAIGDLIAVDTEGIWNLYAYADDDSGTIAINAGDPLYISIDSTGVAAAGAGVGDACISKIVNATTQIPFGYAMGEMGAGLEGTIPIKVHWDPQCHWLLDVAPLFFGDGKDVSIAWSATWNRLQVSVAAPTPALPDGYGFIETNVNATGAATGYTVAASIWVNLSDTFVALAGGSPLACHTDGIYDGGGNVAGAHAFWGKFTEQLGGAPALYTLWNLNLTQTMDALFELNNPALASYTAGSATGEVGSICLFTTGGGGNKYLMLYSNPS